MRSPILFVFALSAAVSASACTASSGEDDQAGSASAISLSKSGAQVLSSTSMVTGTLKLTAGGHKALKEGLESSKTAHLQNSTVFSISCKPDTKGAVTCSAVVAARDAKIDRTTRRVETSMLSSRLFASLPASSETRPALANGDRLSVRQLDALKCVIFPSGDATCNLTFQDWSVETLESAVTRKTLTRDQALDAAQDADVSLQVRD
jgi:hypothetical protein